MNYSRSHPELRVRVQNPFHCTTQIEYEGDRDREGKRGREVEADIEDPRADKSFLVISRRSCRTGLGLLKPLPLSTSPVIRGILMTASSSLHS